MAHSTVLPVTIVEKMKSGKGIGPIIDKIKNNLMIDVQFDGKTKFEMMSDDKNRFEVAEEWIEQKYGGSNAECKVDLQDSTVVWTFSVRASSALKQLYKKEVETLENQSQNASTEQIIINCPCRRVSDVRPKVKALVAKYEDVKEIAINVSGKVKKAKTFCESFHEEACFVVYKEKDKQIIATGINKDVVAKVKSKWEASKKFTEPSSVNQNNEQKPKTPETPGKTAPTKDEVERVSATDTKGSNGTDASVQPGKLRAEIEESRHDKSTGIFVPDDQHVTSSAPGKPTQGSKETTAPGYTAIYPKLDQLQDQAAADKPDIATGASSIVGPGYQKDQKYVFKVGRVKVLIYKQSIVDIQDMDAIVNAANDRLVHAGGVASFISKAAGKSMDDECNYYIKKHGPLDVSAVFVSKPGKLKCEAIFHAVGPRWSEYIGDEDRCAEDLYKTVFKCLECMDERNWRTIALCAISSGKANPLIQFLICYI